MKVASIMFRSVAKIGGLHDLQLKIFHQIFMLFFIYILGIWSCNIDNMYTANVINIDILFHLRSFASGQRIQTTVNVSRVSSTRNPTLNALKSNCFPFELFYTKQNICIEEQCMWQQKQKH